MLPIKLLVLDVDGTPDRRRAVPGSHRERK